MKIAATVMVLALSSCTRVKEQTSEPSTESTRSAQAVAEPAAAAGSRPLVAPTPLPGPSATAKAPAPGPALRSGYAGCGKPLPEELMWAEQDEEEVMNAIAEAKICAAAHGRRLLLEFVAPWCDDCQQMTKLDATPRVAATLRARFERVRINVGRWDRHEALRRNYGVRALATYVVIDPNSSKTLVQTTLEPITKPGQALTAESWSAWLAAQ